MNILSYLGLINSYLGLINSYLSTPFELRVHMPSTDGLKAMYFWKNLIFPFILLYSM